MDGLPYMVFLGTGLPVTAAMWTSAGECSYGTFIRLEFEKVYDGMLAAPLTAENLILGEIIWAGTKGLFFSFSVICILLIFGIVRLPWALLAPFVGFLTGVMFGCLSLWITSFVKTINHFNFYMTPAVAHVLLQRRRLPVSELPRAVQPFAELVPLTHAVYLARAVTNDYRGDYWPTSLIVLFTAITGSSPSNA